MAEQDYIGLDPSYTGFGAVVLHEDGTYEQFLRSWDRTPNPTKRLYQIQDWLYAEVVGAALADRVTVLREGYAPGAKWGREQAGELGAAVNMVFYDSYGKDPLLVAPASLKKFITGKGTGVKKNQILLSVYRKWNQEFTDDNLADAYGLAQLGRALWEDPNNLLAYEREVVKAVKKNLL